MTVTKAHTKTNTKTNAGENFQQEVMMYIGILALVALVSLMGLVCVSCGCQVLRDEGSLVKAWSSLHYLLSSLGKPSIKKNGIL